MDEPSEVMHIRIPKDLAAKIREVSKVENTHLGIALKFIIEQATNDKIETRLTNLEQNLKNWINAQVDGNATLALLNFRVAFLQETLKLAFPFEELTEEQRDKIFSGEPSIAVKFVGEMMGHQKKHYEDTKQTKHPSYKAAVEFFEKTKEMLEGRSPTDEHIT